MKLQILADNRLSNPGKCKTCKFSSYWLEYGAEEWDCVHEDFEKLPELDEEENCINWGTDQQCLLWEPLKLRRCEKHQEIWFPDKSSCHECESEYIDSLNGDEYGY